MTGEEFTRIVGPILRERKIQKKDFCKAVGVSANMWANYEKRGVEPGHSVIINTEKFLNIRFAEHEIESPPTFTGSGDNYSQLELIRLLPQLTLEEYSQILTYARKQVADRKSKDTQE